MTTLFHHTFTPLKGGIVASEAAWKKPGKWERDCLHGCSGGCWPLDGKRWVIHNPKKRPGGSDIVICPKCHGSGPESEPCRVLVAGDDLFAESEGPIRDAKGESVHWPHDSWNEKRLWVPARDTAGDEKLITRADILRRLCAIFDACPNLTFVVRTRHAENVMRMMPPVAGTPDFTRDSKHDGQTYSLAPRPNLILMAECHDQRDIDRQVPHLLRCRELAGVIGVHAAPSEAMNVRGALDIPCPRCGRSTDDNDCPQCAGLGSLGAGIGWLTISGSATPLHPAWVRSLVEQATAAGCPTWFESWGDWAPGSQTDNTALRRCMYADGRVVEFTREALIEEERRSGKPHDNASANIMSRVGSRRSGNTLDGRQIHELPKGG